MSLFNIDKGNTKQITFSNTDTLGTLHSGVPTRTTPTLTPTTLRMVEQAIMDNQVEGHHNQARFVPPVIQPSSQGSNKGACYVSLVDSKSWQGGSTRVVEQPNFRLDLSPKLQQPQAPQTPQPKKNVGGRRPIKDKSMSPEEEERRAVRRERNKLAAARCRKRRLDHTNELLMETDGLQEKKQGLQNEIQQLQLQKEELEFILESHKPCCRVKDGPGSPVESKPMLVDPIIIENEVKKERPPPKLKQSGKRPTTLLVPPQFQPVVTTTADGIVISTPSSGINFNFDSLMAGGTGLTPVSAPLIPSCSTQQRNTGCDLSPDSGKLVSL